MFSPGWREQPDGVTATFHIDLPPAPLGLMMLSMLSLACPASRGPFTR